MFRTVSWLSVVATVGCSLTEYSSNQEDSGVVCQVPSGTDGGWARTTSVPMQAFESAYEVLQKSGNSTVLTVGLYLKPTRCSEIQVPLGDAGIDGGAAWRGLSGDVVLTISRSDGQPFAGGAWPIGASDAGVVTLNEWRWDQLVATADGGSVRYDDGGLVYVPNLVSAKEGTVELDSIEPCRVAGRFQVFFPLLDGGTRGATSQFHAAYCASRRP